MTIKALARLKETLAVIASAYPKGRAVTPAEKELEKVNRVVEGYKARGLIPPRPVEEELRKAKENLRKERLGK